MPSFGNFGHIKFVVFDVDGVFTDGQTWQDASGIWRRTFGVRDAMGIRALKKAGLEIGVVTQAQASEIREFVAGLGVDVFIENCGPKPAVLHEIAKKKGWTLKDIALVSQDERDLPLFADVGMAVTMSTASPSLRLAARLVTEASGGDGAVLEICNEMLRQIRESGASASRTGRRKAS